MGATASISTIALPRHPAPAGPRRLLPPRPRPALPHPADIWTDTERYRRWLGDPGIHHRFLDRPFGHPTGHDGARHPGHAVPVSIVVAFDEHEVDRLPDLIASVRAQTWPGWEMALCPASVAALHKWRSATGLRRRLAARAARGGRRTPMVLEPPATVSPASAINAGLARTTGPMVLIMGAATRLEPDTLSGMLGVFWDDAEPGLIYTDSDEIDSSRLRLHPSFRPDWSPELLLSINYIGPVAAIRRSVIDSLVESPHPLRPEAEPAHIHDLWLRMGESGAGVAHIPRVLHHQLTTGLGVSPRELAEASTRVVSDALERRGDGPGSVEALVRPGDLDAGSGQDDGSGRETTGLLDGAVRVRRWPGKRVQASVIIPFRDQPVMLRRCVDSLLRTPGHDDFEIVLMDNDSAEPETMALAQRYRPHPRIRIIQAPGAFNWSRINNAAAAQARGRVLVFMNNDIEALSPNWLAQLVGQAVRPDVGAVGARLLYPDGHLQHAGVVIGLGLTTHVMRGSPRDDPGYLGMAILARDVSAVTGACLASRRDVFEAVGGFDESMALGYNDIDYCLRLGQTGRRIVYDPVVEMLHHESPTRGFSEEPDEIKQFFGRWGNMVREGDPFYNPNLTHFGQTMTVPDRDEEATWSQFLSNFDRLIRT
ncbi:MAG: glycosyltransferase family 2 protein [Acidimicrobiales bacterium]